VAFLDIGYKYLYESTISKSPILDCVRVEDKSNAGGSVDTGRSNVIGQINAEGSAMSFAGNSENRSVERPKATADTES
jgi:hypothetical protein